MYLVRMVQISVSKEGDVTRKTTYLRTLKEIRMVREMEEKFSKPGVPLEQGLICCGVETSAEAV